MKKMAVLCGAIVIAMMGSGCLEQGGAPTGAASQPIYRHHVSDAAQWARSTNAATLKQILALPTTADLRQVVAQKLAPATRQFWKSQLPADARDQATLLAPLWNDLLSTESFAEVRQLASGAQAVLAVRLEEDRAKLWSDSLTKVLAAWKFAEPKPLTVEKVQGWEARSSAGALQYFRSGAWVIVGLGASGGALAEAWLKQITQAGQPAGITPDAMAEWEVDFPRVNRWLPGLAKYPLPRTRVTVTGRNSDLRAEAKFTYAQALPVKLEPWKIPTEFVADPLISFTAARGVAPLLNGLAKFRDLNLQPMPNQFCIWGQDHALALTHFSTPVGQVTNTIRDLAPTLPKLVRSYVAREIGDFFYISNRAELHFRTLPYTDPHVRPWRQGGQEYLLGALFPMFAQTNPAPKELFQQLEGRQNLVYYDWEITEKRLSHAIQLYSLYDVLNQLQPGSTNAVSQRWLRDVAPKLGNTVTEVTLSSPKELSLVRRGPIGFTGVELATLARWLDSRGFPFTFERPDSSVPAARRVSAGAGSEPIPAK